MYVNMNLTLTENEINNLDVKFLRSINWNSLPNGQLKNLSPKVVMFATLPQILQILKTQKEAKVTNEEVLSLISRLSNTTSNNKLIIDLLTQFVDIDFLKKYYRQILSIMFMNDVPKYNILNMKMFFYSIGLLDIECIFGSSYGLLDIRNLNSNKIKTDVRFNLLKNSNYIAYKLEFEEVLSNMPLILYSSQLELLNYPIPDTLSVHYHGNAKNSVVQMGWDDIINLYYDNKLTYNNIEDLWCDYVMETLSDPGLKEKSLSTYDMNKHASRFDRKDFIKQ